MMKGIRGLLEKDFRLFRSSRWKIFSCVLAIVGLFLTSCTEIWRQLLLSAIYITSVMAIYAWKYN